MILGYVVTALVSFIAGSGLVHWLHIRRRAEFLKSFVGKAEVSIRREAELMAAKLW